MNTTNTFSLSTHCVDEEFRFHLLRRGVRNFLRGIAAALLMPLEMLECLRSGNCAGRGIELSWALSAVMYAGVFEIWNLSNKAIVDSHDRTGPILSCCLVVLVACIWSGSRQTSRSGRVIDASGNSNRKENGLHKHKGMHHRFHPGHHHEGHHHGAFCHPRLQHIESGNFERTGSIESTRGAVIGGSTASRSTARLQNAAAPQRTSAHGNCCGNCRICREPVCVKTGLAKRGRSL